jgi:hypothetical protein
LTSPVRDAGPSGRTSSMTTPPRSVNNQFGSVRCDSDGARSRNDAPI